MVQLRRWVLSSSPRVSLFGTLLLASAAGCQSTRDYAATAVSTIRCWKTPVVETSEPQTSTLVDAKPRPVVPYEETPAILPRPRALLDNDSPTPAPPAELINETPRRSGKLRAETVTVDDVAPAPLPSVDASTVDTADSSTSTADQAAGNAVPVEEKRSDSSTENETGTPPRTAVEPLFDRPIPVPPALPQPVVSPDELPSNATESSIPGLPVEIRPANVQPQATESETSVTPNIEDASRSDSARVQPLFPDTQSVVTVASKVSPDSQPTNERVRPQQRVITSVTLPDPMPTVPATSAREETTLPSVTADQPSREVAIIARLDSEAVCIGFDQNGNLLVASDESLSRISPTGTLQEFAEVDSPRGFASLPGGAFAVCDAHQRSLLRIDSTGRNIDVLAQRSDGHFLKVPSFVAIDASGGVYFT
ncbi:hypothetical protein GC176_10785, partial [bacterium]|nr:hypothetical protein [bacterium]